ncbi:MAG TPA: protein kinase, partial [Thermoanaerobaculia bacterium]|nr:protein kinase [Thermoanaerobaculia bacterium]
MTSPLEQIADKYDILGQLGESGAVEVYKVHHRFLDEVRLLKVIQPAVAMTEAASQGYLREARQAMRLRHPNIAQLFDFSFDDLGHVSLVTEYLEGLTLDAALADLGRPPVGLALEAAQQALRAIGYLHRSGMVHRDVAPDRLCLTRDLDGQPLVKWVDLGVARILAAGEGALPMAGLFPDRPRY